MTGAGGRLGRAVVAALERCAVHRARAARSPGRRATSISTRPTACGRPDRPRPARRRRPLRRLDRRRRLRPRARARPRAQRRSRRASSPRRAPTDGVDLIVVSTNEVFDGRRTDGRRLRARRRAGADQPLRREQARRRAARPRSRSRARPGRAGDRADGVAVRPPGKPDFPMKILAAAEQAAGCRRAAAGRRRRVGLPDLHRRRRRRDRRAPRRRRRSAGTHHLVNGGLRDARGLGARRRSGGPGVDVPKSRTSRRRTWPRPSTPPRWGVLEPTPLPSGEPLRPWPDALADYAPHAPARRIAPRDGRRAEPRAAAVGPGRRPVRRRPAVRATSAARSASCGGPAGSRR